ncbi:hypothetical protein [Solirubrobacter soli]|uniref:hypothetical protein n=1 Tax=Solirubrobacter soli TaxID=363832 RepID=UPI000411FD4F|nr:hypothetical protein [Solirubrobacter soli]
MHLRALLTRLPLTLRALVLIPLLAVGIDQMRVSFVCGPDVRSCLETAGNGRFGLAAVAILAIYTSAIAALVARVAQRRRAPAYLWAVATAGVYAVCGGQAILAELFGGGALLGGGWLQLAAFGVAAGAVIALALHAVPAARELIHKLAPKLQGILEFTVVGTQPPATPQLLRFTRPTRDRAPPAPA